MIKSIYSVFDSKAAIFSPPFYMSNNAMAIRSFGEIVEDKNTMVARHPEDFSLYMLGAFDDETGNLASIKPINLVTASSMIVKPEKVDLGKMINKNQHQKVTVQ